MNKTCGKQSGFLFRNVVSLFVFVEDKTRIINSHCFVRRLFFACLVTLFFLCGCAENKSQNERTYKTCLSLSPAVTETIFHLGKGDTLTGRSEACDYPQDAIKLPVAGRFADPNTEAVISLKPELILTNDLINPNVIKFFESIGIDCKMMQSRNIEDYLEWVKFLGGALDAKDAADQEIIRANEALLEFKSYPKLNLKVIWIIWDAPMMTAGKNSLPDEIISLAGAENVCAEVESEYFKCSSEFLISSDPDVIIWSGPPERDLKKDAVFGKLSAVKKDAIIRFDPNDAILRPGPRIFDAIKDFRKKLETFQ